MLVNNVQRAEAVADTDVGFVSCQCEVTGAYGITGLQEAPHN